jgi:S1-C subfamily serine protease
MIVVDTNVIGYLLGLVDQRSQAWEDNEIRVGDRVIEVNGREVVDFEDVVYAGIFDGGNTCSVLIEREENGKTVRKRVTLALDEDPVFGIKMPAIKARHRVMLGADEADEFPESLGEDRPRDGDELAAVNGRPVKNILDALGLVESSRGEIALTLRRGLGEDAREWTVKHTPRRKFFSEGAPFKADISFEPAPYVDRVQRGSAADKAGLKKGDRLVGVEEAGQTRMFDSFGDLALAIDASQGNAIRQLLEREGKKIPVDVAPDPRESRPGR